MNQLDFVGDLPEPKAAPVLRNTRPSTAEEKANLCFTLSKLCKRPPIGIVNGSVQQVRAWADAQKSALKVLNNSRASVPELSSAVSRMQAFK